LEKKTLCLLVPFPSPLGIAIFVEGGTINVRMSAYIKKKAAIFMALSTINSAPALFFSTPALRTEFALPLAASPISAGFPSSAEEFERLKLNLNDELIKHPEATFYAKA